MDFLTRTVTRWWKAHTEFANRLGAIEAAIGAVVVCIIGAFVITVPLLLLLKLLLPNYPTLAQFLTGLFAGIIGLLFIAPYVHRLSVWLTPHPSTYQSTAANTSPLMRIVIENNLPIPPQHIQDLVNTTYDKLRMQPIPPCPSDDPEWITAYHELPAAINKAIDQSMTAYLKALPPFVDAPLNTPLVEQTDFPNLSYEMIEPFRSTYFKNYNVLQNVGQQFMANAQALHFKLPPSQVPRDKRLIMPQTYKADNTTRAKTFYKDHLFMPLFEVQTPFPVYDEHRFAHTWIMGRQGSGKTTLLSAMIWDDLQRMAQGECSIFVMDSQDNQRFLKSLVRLKQFAPGGEWHDRLIYIEPDLQWTPALNPLDIGDISRLSENERYEVTQTASTVVGSLFSSLLDVPLTGKQDILYDFLVPALIHIKGATLETALDLLQPNGYLKYQNELSKAPEHVRRWFKTHMTPKPKGAPVDQFSETAKELFYRIEGVFADQLFARMFSHTENKLDLFEKLSRPNIVVINTMQSRLKDKVEAFGRLFIAKLMIAMQQRGDDPNPLPCFAYIDEATDYIANEERVATLIFKARKQRVGLALAHHDLTDIQNPRVKAALQKAAVQLTPAPNFQWNLSIDSARIHTVVKPILTDFSKMELMTAQEWQTVLREQREQWCIQHRNTEIKEAPPREWGKW